MPNQKNTTVAGKGDSKAQNGGFRTDSAISASRAGGERVLQRWQPDSADAFEHSLDKSTAPGSWDQFATNERLFGLKTDYDENMYTTSINTSLPGYREKAAVADQKVREIERSVPTTSHVAEERVMDYAGGDDGGDEEDKYSGVKRNQQADFPPLPGGSNRANKYTPPARRAPTGAATVKGAPVDPAIISSQLRAQKPQHTTKSDDPKSRAPSTSENAVATSDATTKAPEVKAEIKTESAAKSEEAKPIEQAALALKPSTNTNLGASPSGKEGGAAPSATATVERDVLKEFKVFANQQRSNAEKARSTKAKADKEVKLIELKKFATNFKLPTPVPMDLIGIIAKDPAKQKAIQEKAARDAAECLRLKAEEKAAQDKKPSTNEDAPAPTNDQGASADRARPTGAPSSAQPTAAAARHPNSRQSYVPQPYQQFRGGPQHMGQGGRHGQGLVARIRNNAENQKMPPTGPANPVDPSYLRRGGMPVHMGNKLNPNSHEFRPSPFASSFTPNGHPSATSSPRSALNQTAEQSGPGSSTVSLVVTKKRNAVSSKKCSILIYLKNQPKPEGKNYADNDDLKPSFDTPPTWRQSTGDEKPESTMSLSYVEYFERQPFATQPTPNPAHAMPQMAHQHQLPFHLQQGAHNNGPRSSPHGPPAPMHPGQHGPIPHAPYNGDDNHRMMHSNSSQSFASPRMGPVPVAAYPQNMNSPAQMPYGQNGMPFMPGTPQQMGGHFNRSFSNNPQYMPQQQMPMGTPMMIQPQFITPQGMPAGQMQMYPGGPQFMPPGAGGPQPMPGTNGYPSPGRPAAPMMVHQGSQQGQPMYGMSPGVQYQQPVFPQQQGQLNNMRGYSNPGPQQFGNSPQQMHQYNQHRNGSNHFKSYQGHGQHQNNHQVPSGPQGRTPDATDEAK